MEMNAHLPQSYEAMVELEEIAAVPNHIITPRHAKPVIGIFQDTLVGTYRLTHPNEFTRKEYMNLMMWNKRFDGNLQTPRGGSENKPRWTGQQVLTSLLPPLNIDMGNKAFDSDKENNTSKNYVKIKQGDVLQGIVDGDVYMKPSKGIIHTTYNDYGPKDTVELIDSLQNTVEHFLVLNGFSVGISDLVADTVTKQRIEEIIAKQKKEVEQKALEVHLDLFENNTGKTNQQEFEDQTFSILNKATADAGKSGEESLSSENRLVAMVKSGSKGDQVNIAQMIACLGQQAIDGKRIAYGFTDRTLPHYKKYDDGAEARGFIESSFIRGLTPQEFFFHAMSGREGLIDTAVKSVTADTEIVIIEDGVTKHTRIGDWIDRHIDQTAPEKVEHYDEANMELVNLTTEVYIPTTDMDGNITWGKMTAVTRHDPGDKLYEIKTQSGKEVIVTAGKSLLIWDEELCKFKQVFTKSAKIGDYMPVTMNLPTPPTVHTYIDMSKYFPKTEYVYGTDFHIAKKEMEAEMNGRCRIPSGWWESTNGTKFTLPYPSKARFQRVNSGRSNVEHIKEGVFYPYRACRNDVLLPERFELNERNGIFIGLFLADGNVDIPSGYVQITKNNDAVRTFVKEWFDDMGIAYKERSREIQIKTVNETKSKGVSSDIRGYSRLLGQFLDALVGHGSENKYVPDIAFTAPIEFVKGLLNGYFSGDGCVCAYSIEACSTSSRLIDGIAMLCSRLGIFAYKSMSQLKQNNVGTKNILPVYDITIRSKWIPIFKNNIKLVNDEKQDKLNNIKYSDEHINYSSHNDIILDKIKEINEIDTALYPKMYDVTVPSTLNFSIANALHLSDTADTGYLQRQLIKAMEDLTVQHDGSVRDANMNIFQFHYGEDGIAATKIETQSIGLAKLSQDEIRKEFGMMEVDWATILQPGTIREENNQLIQQYVEDVLYDQEMLVEGVFKNSSLDSGSVFAPANIARLINNIKIRFNISSKESTDLTPEYVLNGIQKIVNNTSTYHKIWIALLRFHCAPHKLIVKERFTKIAFDTLCEILVLKHMQSWVQPGEQVGIVAAQSIGEPSTQMSCTNATYITAKCGENKIYSGQIGEFIDQIIKENSKDVVTIGENSVVLDLKNDYYIVGVSEDEKVSWKRISQVSRHPANGGLVEVHTRSGRKTTATLSHSFLKRDTFGIVPVLGSDLKVGMRIPIAREIPEIPNPLTEYTHNETTIKLNKQFGWLCGAYLADGSINGNYVKITKVIPIFEEIITDICTQYGWKFSTRKYDGEYGPGKDNNIRSRDLASFLTETFKTGSFDKEVGALVYHSNKEFIAGLISGYFDGDGNVNVPRQMIRASSRSKKLIQDIARLLGYTGVFATICEEKSVNYPGQVQYTLQIIKKHAKLFKERIGLSVPEKSQGIDEIIQYNDRDDKHTLHEQIDKIPELGEVIAQTGKLLKMPGQSRNFGRWAKKDSIGRATLEKYVAQFEQKMAEEEIDHENREQVNMNMGILKSALYSDVIWDEIMELNYLPDPQEFVYDFTVPGNDSFMVDENILVHNTLNSVDWDTRIIYAKDGKLITHEIGDLVDSYIKECEEKCPEKIQRFPNDQIYVELNDGHDWKAVSCDEDGKVVWTKLEAITRHPVVNEDGTDTILEVKTKSGRIVKATKGKSFLTYKNGKVLETNGSDLKIGDLLPIANTLAIKELGVLYNINLREILPPTEYIYGTDVQIAMNIMKTENENGNRHWFTANNGKVFTVPYSRSDGFRDAFVNGRNSNEMRKGCVYPKRTRPDISHIPENIPLDEDFGFFCGAYLAEGMSNTTQINITNNDQEYLDKVDNLMNKWNVGTHRVSEDRHCEKTNIRGKSSSLIIHSTILSKVMSTMFGRVSYEKNIPDWTFQAPKEFVQGLIDGYITGDGCIEKESFSITASSVSFKLLNRLRTLLASYGIYSTITSYMPEKRLFDSVVMSYRLRINAYHSEVFANTFKLSMKRKQEIIDKHMKKDKRKNKYKLLNDVILDEVVSINELRPLKGLMYDITVCDTRNFLIENALAIRDTFHQAGVASKSSVTRGVPRLRELLKVTKNPKATSLTMYLKPEFRQNKEKAREVVQDLELTLLKNITKKVAIYWDPNEGSSVIEEDRELLEFYRLFEQGMSENQIEISESNKSKWVLRLELNREEMFNRNISMQDIAFVINNAFSNEISVVYSDYNSQKLVMRIRLDGVKENIKAREQLLDDFTNLKKFQTKLLNSIVIRGIPGIKAVTFRKDKQKVIMQNGKYEELEQYILDTDGTNFVKVMNHPAIDGTKLYSTNVHDVFEVLGTEATREILYSEIAGLFSSVGVNYRHLGLLCDVMTRSGKLMSIDRYGINKNDIGPLAKASFEETGKIMLKASMFGEVDPVTGVSANIMVGQTIRGGTAFSQVLLDEAAMIQLYKDTEIDEDEQEETANIIDLLEEGTRLNDPCATSNFQMNMTMPKASLVIEEEDVEVNIIE